MSDRYTFVIDIDPATLSTAQQKKVSFKQRRIFSNPKVVAAKRAVALLALPHRKAVRDMFGGDTPLRLEATYYYKFPSSFPKKQRAEGMPKTIGADCDNINKAPQDALGNPKNAPCGKNGAGLWDDDKRISTLVISKRYTTGKPRIKFTVSQDY